VIDRLATALQAALEDATLKARYAELATEPVSRELATPAALATLLKTETDKWGPIIAKAGVHPE
jgi:tripartite-type tricarboxylate transporter receptor subunit TctC